MRFFVTQRRNWRGRLQWHFVGKADGNNETILQGEAYHNLDDALAAVELIAKEAATASVHIQGVSKDQPAIREQRKKPKRGPA